MKKSLIPSALLVASVAAISGLSGCSSSGSGDVSYGSITGNPTPHLSGMVERPVDIDRNMVFARNHNWRMLSDDLGRVFLTNHPSQLSPLPITRTSGMPR